MLTDVAPEVGTGGSPLANETSMVSNDESHALAAYNIPNSRIGDLEIKVQRLARRAAKLGMAKVELVQVKPGPRTKQRRNEDGQIENYELAATWCELRGPSPVLSGYTFLARLEHTDLGNLVSRVPGAGDEIDLTAYRSVDPKCDHCKHRRIRKDTFVLRTPEGGLVQIGRNCLADYLRSANVDVVLAMLQLTEEISRSADEGDDEGGEGGFGGGWALVLPVLDYVAASVVAVREFGWVSRGAIQKGLDKTATADHASFISGRCPTDERGRAEWRRLQPNEDDRKRAEAVIAWIASTTDTGDYMYNLRLAVALDNVTGRTRGLLASAPNAYAKEVEKQIAARSERKVSSHVGTKGERRLFAGVRLVRKAYVDTAWGSMAISVFEDPNGNLLVWKTNSNGADDLERDAVYDVKATIKEHSDYKGTAQTELSRCAVTEAKKTDGKA